MGVQFGPQFNYGAPGALIYLFWGPWGPYLFILGPLGAPIIYLLALWVSYWPCGFPIGPVFLRNTVGSEEDAIIPNHATGASYGQHSHLTRLPVCLRLQFARMQQMTERFAD